MGVPRPEPQKTQDLRSTTVLLREGVLSMLTFLNTTVFMNWWEYDRTPVVLNIYLFTCPQYFPEGVLKNKLNGSNLTREVTLCPYWLLSLQHAHSRLLLSLRFHRSPSSNPRASSCLSDLMHKVQALPWFWVLPAGAGCLTCCKHTPGS